MIKAQIARGLTPCQPRSGRFARLKWPTPSHPHIFRLRASSQSGESDAGKITPGPDDLPPELRDLQVNEDGFLIDTKTGKVINEMGATRFDVAVRALRGELDPPSWVENSERTPGIILSALYQFPRSYLFQVVGRPTTAVSTPTTSTAPDGESAGGCHAGSSSGSASATAGASAISGAARQLQPKEEGAVAPVAAAAAAAAAGGCACGKEAFVRDVTAVIYRVTQTPEETGKVEVKERLGGKYVSVAVDVLVRAPELVSMVYDELAKDPRVIMKF